MSAEPVTVLMQMIMLFGWWRRWLWLLGDVGAVSEGCRGGVKVWSGLTFAAGQEGLQADPG